ncbi:MAG: type II toxin-antitoxin system VapC family toxin [Candidatus Binatia bacterium]
MGHGALIVLDTHALIWWIAASPALSRSAKRAIEAAARNDCVVASTISILEIATAVRRQRLELRQPLGEWVADVRALPELRFEPISVDIAARAGAFDDAMLGDPADRLILATAAALGTKLVSADRKLRGNRQVEVVW